MWDNKVLKQKAKERMKVNYWKMLLVGLIIALVSGGTGASSSARNYVTGVKRRHSMMITMRMHSFPEEILIRT